jgi:hypothetical protein
MHELPEDLTNSLRSFRGSIYGRGQTPQGGQSARVEDTDLEKGPEDYRDQEFDRALDTSSQSSFDMVRQVSTLSAVEHDQTNLQGAAIGHISTKHGSSTAGAAR